MFDNGKRAAAFILIIGVLGILIFYFSPLLDSIAMGIVFAYVSRPFMKRIPLSKAPSAILATIMVVVPIALVLILSLYDLGLWAMSEWKPTLEMVEEAVSQLPAGIQRVLDVLPEGLGQEFLSIEGTKGMILLILNFLLAVLLCCYLLIDGKKVVSFITDIFHVEDEDGKLIAACDKAISGIYIGSFYTAFIVAVITVPVLLAFRIPHILAFIGIMFLAALIPILAEWMVLLIPLGYLLVIEEAPPTTLATFIIIGAIFLYILPELLIRPWLTGRQGKIHPLLMLFAFIGGGLAGGVSGFFLAPMFTGILVTIYRVRGSHGER